MIELALAFQDKDGQYAEHAGVVLASVFQNTRSSVNVHILHDETLSEDNRQKLIELTASYNQTIIFYPLALPEDLLQVMASVGSINVWTPACMYRLLLPAIIPADRIIYLDCDVLVNMDLEELWQVELNHFYLGAVWDQNIMNVTNTISSKGLNPELYFNSGVILFALNTIRANLNWYGETLNFLRNFPDTAMPDQDALNAVYGRAYLPLDVRFNLFNMAAPDRDFSNKIVHFAGDEKCWDRHSSGWELYRYYLNLTPWREQTVEEPVNADFSATPINGNRIKSRKRKTTGRRFRTRRNRFVRIALTNLTSVKSAKRNRAAGIRKRRKIRRRIYR
ncbi:glycosyltransferase family 8 protein [Paenibacillus oralis]|uniref:Glycosyltransferase family 8 protein n=1 Tax=Paenibacillus oralis TaxID=2490856 RepID=A0A3P3U357_9BACL|nr:glycosyltransferase family 8 protein [Paenibacillus oralis]RRJ64761.1 glycosyltransferase family 8 protein [Paenibacillus oralis]